MKGPIENSFELKNSGIIDIVLTILVLLSVALPSDMDGKIPQEMVAGDFLHTHPIRYNEKENFETDAAFLQ